MLDKTPYLLLIFDGFGHGAATGSNAIHLARSPVWDDLWSKRPHTLISGSGPDVGLPAGQMGNSEVGHMSLGAGRVVDQDFTRITRAIDDGSFRENPTLQHSLATLGDTGRALHLLGLLSSGGVHSHQDHIEAAVTMAFAAGVKTVYLHGFLDGRDVPPKSAQASIEKLQQSIVSLGNGGIASLIGRYYAMDRDNRWERIEAAYKLLTAADTKHIFHSPMAALDAAYHRGESDEFIQASAIKVGGKLVTIEDGDAVWFMNFRPDRARQLTRAFVNTNFSAFKRYHQPKLSAYVMLTNYAADINTPSAFTKQPLHNSLGEYVSSLGKSQLRIAETEKYAHVTFFFSGGQEHPFPGEDRKLIASPRVSTYDLQPQMSAPELTDALTQRIRARCYDLLVCNYANGDMVGHTGNLSAAIKAVECLDECLGKIIQALAEVGGHCLITADHGNVEQMRDPATGQAHTAHTTERVPLVYVGNTKLDLLPSGGTLSDVAPTLLTIMGLEQPPEMTGLSLVIDTASSLIQTHKTS